MSTINVTNLSGRGGATPNLPDGANITGVATASGGFSGNLTGNVTGTGLTTGSDGSINVTSIRSVGVSTLGNVVITCAVGGGATVGAYAGVTTFYGDGSSLTGVGDSVAPHYYNPDVNDSTVPISTGIGFTFNKKISSGSGTATIKVVNAGAAGTTIQSWGVSSCTFGITTLEFGRLVSNLTENQTYQVDIPSGFIVDGAGSNYAGTAYTFATGVAKYTLWAWGYGGAGRMAQNSQADRSSPVQIPGTTWNIGYGVYGNGNSALIAPKSDGTLFAWGNNSPGQLGQNSRANRSSPVQIPGTTWAPYGNSQSNKSTLCTKTDGTLWGWGANEFGMLGLNQSGGGAFISSPTQIGSETTWPKDGLDGKMTGGGELMHFAIKTDGTLWGMGWNSMGQLGQNSTVGRSSPVQIPGTTWSFIQCGEQSIRAIKTDGTLWAWGGNEVGELGQNAAGVEQSSPVQIPGTTWSKVFSANKSNWGVKTDGTLWAWGDNEYGNLGLNAPESSQKSSPTQLPGTTWKQVAGGLGHDAYAIKTDGTLWSWGKNENGAIAQPVEALDISSPVQVGSETDWDRVIPNNSGGFGVRKT